jgi:hypothetical protein
MAIVAADPAFEVFTDEELDVAGLCSTYGFVVVA